MPYLYQMLSLFNLKGAKFRLSFAQTNGNLLSGQ